MFYVTYALSPFGELIELYGELIRSLLNPILKECNLRAIMRVKTVKKSCEKPFIRRENSAD